MHHYVTFHPSSLTHSLTHAFLAISVATSLAGSKSDISYNEFQSQLLRRPVGLEMRKEEKRQRESSSEFKSVSELDPHWYDHSRTNSDLQMRQAATNLFHRCMEVNTWSSDDSIFCEFNRSRSSHGSSENASMKTHSNDGDKKDLTSKERMELETTETTNMV